MSTSTITNYDYDCTKKCKCREHGTRITSAITKRGINDENLACFIAKTCRNFAQILDVEGRSALHMASSTDRYLIVEWLLNHGAVINAKDQESGSSALHRAIYYGCIDCAVLLLRYGANYDLTDDDHLKPLQLVCKLCNFNFARNVPDCNELLVWGPNKNYNLGIGNEQGTANPQFIDYFRKQNICITSMSISSYHSLFLDTNGNVYSVGHGKDGRLGIGTENSLPTPKKLHIQLIQKINRKSNNTINDDLTNLNNDVTRVIQISCSKNHSLLLTNKSMVYSCGLNTNYQLGIETKPNKLLNFKEITSFKQYGVQNLKQIIAKDQHSIAYSDRELFVWGTNHGQFGLSDDTAEYILLPRNIHTTSSDKIIEFVESSNTAVACCISGTQILLFHNNKMRTLKYPTLGQITAICLTEREIDSKKTKNSSLSCNLKMLILADSHIYIWYESLHQYIRCFLSPMRYLDIEKILYKNDKILLLSNGDVYQGKVIKIPVQIEDSSNTTTATTNCTSTSDNNNSTFWGVNLPNNKNDLSSKHIIKIDLKHISSIDRVTNIFCDDEFQSFGILQENSKKYYHLPKLLPEENTFKKLLNESNEHDLTHDLVFHVNDEKFYCHKFIIYSKSQGLLSITKQYEDKIIYLNYKHLTAKMFEIILKHIYTNYYLIKEDLDDISQSLGPDRLTDPMKVAEIFLSFVEKFELKSLAAQIRNYIEGRTRYLEEPSLRLNQNLNRFERTKLPELYDVTIKCGGNVEIKAHKCVLISRLEYFDMMLNNSWSENKFINLQAVPYEYLQPIIDYLYTLDIDKFRKDNYSETFLYNMIIVCDQFFINHLRKQCEILILDKITIRKCGEMLQFSITYNCQILQNGCLEFICQNLQRVLMHRSLEDCEFDALKNLNQYYRRIFKEIFDYRIITPYSDAISDDDLIKFIQDFHTDLHYKMSEDQSIKNKTKSKLSKINNKLAQSKRDYEKQAINSMNKLLLIADEHDPPTCNSSNQKDRRQSVDDSGKENEEINGKLKNSSSVQNWMKVLEKKENKKKSLTSAVIATKCNNLIKEDKLQIKSDLTNLNNLIKTTLTDKMYQQQQQNEQSNTANEISPRRPSNYSFGDLTPQKFEKISQKQRKRLSSESKSDLITSPPQPTVSNSIPINNSTHNPWGTSHKNECNDIEIVSTSFAEIMKTPSGSTKKQFTIVSDKSVGVSQSVSSFQSSLSPVGGSIVKSIFSLPSSGKMSTTSAFTKILEEEKKQKEYYERMKNKSLVLTQIEEAAITELKQFYNVDNVFDERITIERKSIPITANFVVWQRNERK